MRLRTAAIVVLSCLLFDVCGAATPSDFPAVATVTGEFSPDIPVRVPLTAEVFSRARPDLGDLRVFDDLGRETPYVIYLQTVARRAPVSFHFEIVTYNRMEEAEEFTLLRPRNAGPFHEIEFVIQGTDFHKRVEVSAGSHATAMAPVASDVIFDFSSRVNLRKTRVSLPETDAAAVQVTLRDLHAPGPSDPAMRLKYEDLEFWTAGSGDGAFRIKQILGWSGESKSQEHFYDSVTMKHPSPRVDENGNSLVDLNVRVPMAYVTLDVANPYFYRRVQVLTTGNQEDEWRLAGTGVIYKAPGMPASEDTIYLETPLARLRFVVLNEDNPPLNVQSIEVGWIRRNLYFVPEAGRTYRLFVGGELVRLPRYELRNLIPSDHAELMRFPELSLAGLEANPAFAPQMAPASRERIERYVLVLVIGLLVGGLLGWAYRLLKKMPPQAAQ